MRIKNISKLLLGFVTGVLSGMFIRLSFEMIGQRPTAVGGEVLLLPLLGLLLCLGFWLGRESKVYGRFQSVYEEGYADGVAKRRGLRKTGNIHTGQ